MKVGIKKLGIYNGWNAESEFGGGGRVPLKECSVSVSRNCMMTTVAYA